MSEIKEVDSERLENTQAVRQMIIDAMVPGGEVTRDPKELAILAKTLDGMDKQVFSKARQKSMEKTTDNLEAMRGVVEQVFRRALEEDDGDDSIADEAEGAIPEVDLDTDGVPEFAKEEGLSDETFEEFSERMGD